MKVEKKVTIQYVGEDGFEFDFKPVENSITIKKTKKGYEARYLVQDQDSESPENWKDDNLFLVGYHREFTVNRGQRELVTIFKKEDFKKDNGYNGRVYEDGYGWKNYAEAKKAGLINKEVRRGKYTAGIGQELAQCIINNGKYEDGSINEEAKEYIKKYHIFGLEAYIHSGVILALRNEGNFCDRQWDVSQLGICFASKKEWKTRNKARKAILSLIKKWNYYLSGQVYGVVRAEYNKNKVLTGSDERWGYYGYEYASEALKENI